MRPVFVLALLLTGCLGAEAPIISDIDDSSVKIQVNAAVPQDQVDAKAAEGCAVYGKQRTEALSERRFGQYGYMREVLYACR